MVSQSPTPGDVGPEQFAELVAAWRDDSVIVEGIRAVGTDQVLEQVFDQMGDRLRPRAIEGVDADVQWLIEGRDETHAYVLRISDGTGETAAGETDDPRVTFRADVATFARLITGQANPVRLVLARKLKVRGDLLFARRVPTFFDMPGA